MIMQPSKISKWVRGEVGTCAVSQALTNTARGPRADPVILLSSAIQMHEKRVTTHASGSATQSMANTAKAETEKEIAPLQRGVRSFVALAALLAHIRTHTHRI